MNRFILISFFTVVFSAILALPSHGNPSGVVRFNRDIRPILSDNCYNCHGPDQGTRKAGLRLDTEQGALADLSGYFPIVPGKPDQSEVFYRITTEDRDDIMPPPKSGKTLSEREKDLIKRWIEQGAKFEGHWAYIAPQRPAVPKVKNKRWPKNPIDRFVLARLESERLRPSPAAGRRTLLRRLSFDLTGLPPGESEMRAFASDRGAAAYEQFVDRLLASPHFGERMAVHWLDLVRYADSSGFHGDQPVPIFPYRDYVIAAFNENKPFDQFSIEQIAGDLLPGATRDQVIASGHNRLHRMTGEGGAQDKEYLAIYSADRVRNLSAAWLGSTVGCAECHDHKFDPFTAKDFYSLAAFFADLEEKGVYGSARWEPFIDVATAQQEERMAQLNARIAAVKKTLDTTTPEIAAARAIWERELQAEVQKGLHDWRVIRPRQLRSSGRATLRVQDDDSVLSTNINPDSDIYTANLRTDKANITGIRLEALTHPTLHNGSLSRGNGNFVLTGLEVEVSTGQGEPQPVSIAGAMADYEQAKYPVSAAIDGNPQTGWAVDGHGAAENRTAVFVFAEPVPGGKDTVLGVRLKHESAHLRHNIGRFRLSLTATPDPALPFSNLPAPVVAALQVAPDERAEEQNETVAAHYRTLAPELAGAREEHAALVKEKERLDGEIPKTLVSVSVEPREIRVLPRGNWMDDSGQVVQPAVPHFLRQIDAGDRRPTRLDLAQWLVSRDNPLTARVFVNHLWKMFFGTGLSKTVEDFGSQGEWPTHPELLDWLAVEFVESGWDIKHVVRLMVTSNTYRQSSDNTRKLRELDPFNRLLARQSRFRLEAEMVRDNALQVSGLLVPQIGGPSVKPYQPEGYWDQLNFPKRTYESDTGDKQYRRGLYVHWQRTFLHPSLMAFDAPAREECTAERVVSNTPLQALALLNDPTYVEAARVFAERIVRDGGPKFDQRLKWAYFRALSREPSRTERRLLGALYQRHHEQFSAETEAAEQLIGAGLWPKAGDLNAAELAAWTSVSRAILNLHETITRY